MKKLGKFIATIFSIAAVLGGALYFYKNIFNKAEKDNDEFDDFDFDDFDEFDDLDSSDTNDSADKAKSTRGYTTLDMDSMKRDSEEKSEEESHENVEVFDLNEE